MASLWNGPFPSQWPGDSRGAKAQTIPSASLESSSLGTVGGVTQKEGSYAFYCPMPPLPPPKQPHTTKGLPLFSPNREEEMGIVALEGDS